jgi:hypothetical protein
MIHQGETSPGRFPIDRKGSWGSARRVPGNLRREELVPPPGAQTRQVTARALLERLHPQVPHWYRPLVRVVLEAVYP